MSKGNLKRAFAKSDYEKSLLKCWYPKEEKAPKEKHLLKVI